MGAIVPPAEKICYKVGVNNIPQKLQDFLDLTMQHNSITHKGKGFLLSKEKIKWHEEFRGMIHIFAQLEKTVSSEVFRLVDSISDFIRGLK